MEIASSFHKLIASFCIVRFLSHRMNSQRSNLANLFLFEFFKLGSK
jgi:hypothetical protein